jgi:hypothetical protein
MDRATQQNATNGRRIDGGEPHAGSADVPTRPPNRAVQRRGASQPSGTEAKRVMARSVGMPTNVGRPSRSPPPKATVLARSVSPRWARTGSNSEPKRGAGSIAEHRAGYCGPRRQRRKSRRNRVARRACVE